MIDEKTKEKDIFYLFEGSLILKGAHAIIEIVGGFLILLISQRFIVKTILFFVDDEISEDSRDFVSNYLIHVAQNFSIGSKHFIALYLLSHGIIKGILVISLWQKKLWAYPVSIIVFGLFIVYQIARYTYTHSIWLIIFTVFDIFVIWLIYHEYRIQKRKFDSITQIPKL